MTLRRNAKVAVAAIAFAALVIAGMLVKSPRVQAQSSGDDQESRIERGFDIAPVPLNLEGKNRPLVGLGSYLVNAIAGCNDCHSAGPSTPVCSRRKPILRSADQDRSSNLPGRRAGFRSFGSYARLPTYCFTELNPGQNRPSRRRPLVPRVSSDLEDGSGSGSLTSALFRDCDHQLSSATFRWKSFADYALAYAPEHD